MFPKQKKLNIIQKMACIPNQPDRSAIIGGSRISKINTENLNYSLLFFTRNFFSRFSR